jgi:hypothetical protein
MPDLGKALIPAATDGRGIRLRTGTLLDGITARLLRNAHIVYNKSEILSSAKILLPQIF